MTVNLKLTPRQEAAIRGAARRRGVSVEAYTAEAAASAALLEDQARTSAELPVDLSSREGLGDLFAKWRAEDATDDEDELSRRDQELAELKAALNHNRVLAGERPLFP